MDQLQPAYADWSQQTGGSAIEMHTYGPPELLEQPDATLWFAGKIAAALQSFRQTFF